MYTIINFQRCTQQFQAQGNAEEFVELVVDNMRYIGPEDLTQYFIRNTTMQLSEDKKSVIVEAWAIKIVCLILLPLIKLY